ncbi:MAG: hypothetical protein PHD58_01690 [Anaerolineales bacterium]|nr:hypothetical protein [Anaerolineales bacterium]
MVDDDPIVHFFHKHLVPILFTVQEGSISRQFIITAFVLSVENHWFLVTAGHCLREIETLKANGTKIISCALIDKMGDGAKHVENIPFAYENAFPEYSPDELEYDYGVIALSRYYCQLLEANNIKPLTEEVWDLQPNKFDFYKLIGVPYELLEITPEYINITSALFDVEPLNKWPNGIAKTSSPQFIGKITLGKGIQNIEGTSGGPIFGFRENPPGTLKYWLVALQSRWRPTSQIVIGCPTKLLGQFLRSRI